MFRTIRTNLFFIAFGFALIGTAPAIGQHAGGIAQCLFGCARSDKPCQDSCIPATAMSTKAHACITNCRSEARDEDLMVRLKACIGGCVNENAATQ